jgi:hypothetical protein
VFEAVSVGNKPSALSSMWSSDVDSTHHKRFAGVVDLFQVSDDPVSAASSESRAVLNDDETGSNLGDEASVFAPEAGAVSVESGATTRKADVLAGEASADDISGNSICPKLISRERPNVLIDWHLRPMLAEHGAAIGFDLAERDRAEASPLKAETEAADA